MMRLGLVTSLLVWSGAGCAHYSTHSAYQGHREFKTPSDYSPAREPAAKPSVATTPPAPFEPQAEFKLHWPVDSVRINRGYRPASDPAHQGVDFGGLRNTPILAAHEGVVIYAGHHFNGYGNMVLVEYNKEWATLYAHMTKINVKEGRVVLPGDLIGKMGSTGRASGVHLLFELMKNRQPIDPLPFLAKPPRLTAGR